ncbi:MAG: tRNA (adenosine(37)-N6)-dimethylallyltransferase MiaA [Gemmatimonadaceae bacterium]|nr:tRNA (adenosine(37)-N6)-dimethylallyltransferase MiaA [Gemmatimonadaceae bacterium]
MSGASAGAEVGAEVRAELRIVCGPTGAGKSALALALAQAQGLTILVADSRQVYRGFDIGTANPTAAERARVPHEGCDLADPTDRYSAAAWAAHAADVIRRVGVERVLIVGGTGLYLKALTEPLFEEPPLDPVRRAALAAELEPLDTGTLRRWVTHVDACRAGLGRTQLLRALEVAMLTGKRISDLHREAARAPHWRARWLVVDPGDDLHARIERRIEQMLADGWLDEVRALAARLPDSAPAWNACGYEALRDVVHGASSLEEAKRTILVATRQYAKRQRTWFRHQLTDDAVTHIDPRSADSSDAVGRWCSEGRSA